MCIPGAQLCTCNLRQRRCVVAAPVTLLCQVLIIMFGLCPSSDVPTTHSDPAVLPSSGDKMLGKRLRHAPHRALLSGSARVSVSGSQSREEESRTGFETTVFQFYMSVLEYHISQACTNFPISRGHLKILGTRWSKFYTRAGEQNLRACAPNVYKFIRNPFTYTWEL